MQDEEEFYITVPPEFRAEAAASVEIMHAVLKERGQTADDEIRLVEPHGKGFEPITTTAALYIGSVAGSVLVGFGRKWFEQYLEPEILRRLGKPSERFASWLCDQMGLPKDD
jgi:hypothetical protein